jgi:hypothetical protein
LPLRCSNASCRRSATFSGTRRARLERSNRRMTRMRFRTAARLPGCRRSRGF